MMGATSLAVSYLYIYVDNCSLSSSDEFILISSEMSNYSKFLYYIYLYGLHHENQCDNIECAYYMRVVPKVLCSTPYLKNGLCN